MKFVLFVEGHTESEVLPRFLKRWLDPRLSQPVGITRVRFEGWCEFIDDVEQKASEYLEGSRRDGVIAVIGLLDLYGPTIYPDHAQDAPARIAWAKEHIESKVGHPKFRQFFAVHELEAWLLSQPEVFPRNIREAFPRTITNPEQVNFDEPPAKLLNRLYRQKTRRNYKKVVNGLDLFAKLDPKVAYSKCPNLKHLLDEMLALAQAAGC